MLLAFVDAVDGHEDAFGSFDGCAPAERAFEAVEFGEATEDDVECGLQLVLVAVDEVREDTALRSLVDEVGVLRFEDEEGRRSARARRLRDRVSGRSRRRLRHVRRAGWRRGRADGRTRAQPSRRLGVASCLRTGFARSRSLDGRWARSDRLPSTSGSCSRPSARSIGVAGRWALRPKRSFGRFARRAGRGRPE
jgi:hypothetical protein